MVANAMTLGAIEQEERREAIRHLLDPLEGFPFDSPGSW